MSYVSSMLFWFNDSDYPFNRYNDQLKNNGIELSISDKILYITITPEEKLEIPTHGK